MGPYMAQDDMLANISMPEEMMHHVRWQHGPIQHHSLQIANESVVNVVD